MVPGDPTIIILGDQASEAAREALRARSSASLPILSQYFDFLWQVLHGDLGRSLATNRADRRRRPSVLPFTIE